MDEGAARVEFSTDGPPGVRRLPTQQRSRLRVRRMLESAAALADEVGYEGATMSRVADRAGVPVGSLYQFFPDKKSLFNAVVAGYVQRLVDLVEEAFSDHTPEDWREDVDRVIDTYMEFYRTEPGFGALWYGGGGHLDPQLLASNRANNEVLAERLFTLFRQRHPEVEHPRLDFAFRISVEISGRLLDFAFQRDTRGDTEVVAEAKTVIKDYLASYLDH